MRIMNIKACKNWCRWTFKIMLAPKCSLPKQERTYQELGTLECFTDHQDTCVGKIVFEILRPRKAALVPGVGNRMEAASGLGEQPASSSWLPTMHEKRQKLAKVLPTSYSYFFTFRHFSWRWSFFLYFLWHLNMSPAFKIAEYAKVHSLEGHQDMSLQNMPLGHKNYFKGKVIHLKPRYTFPSVKPCWRWTVNMYISLHKQTSLKYLSSSISFLHISPSHSPMTLSLLEAQTCFPLLKWYIIP